MTLNSAPSCGAARGRVCAFRRARKMAPLLLHAALALSAAGGAEGRGAPSPSLISAPSLRGDRGRSADAGARSADRRRRPLRPRRGLGKKSSKGGATANNTRRPTPRPTAPSPTAAPSSAEPTGRPTAPPAALPPTDAPARGPTSVPTSGPTAAPSGSPTTASTFGPTSTPTETPTEGPTGFPSRSPSPTTSEALGPDDGGNRTDGDGETTTMTTIAAMTTTMTTTAAMTTTKTTQAPSESPSLSTPSPSSKARSSPDEVSLSLPLMSLTLTLPDDAAEELSSDKDVLVDHVSAFVAGAFDAEFRDTEFLFLRADVEAEEWSSWPVPREDIRRQRRLGQRVFRGRRRLDGDDQSLSAVSATLSGEAYFDGAPLPSDEAVRYFLHKWFAPLPREDGAEMRSGSEVGADFAGSLAANPDSPLAEVLSYDFSLDPNDNMAAAQEDAPRPASDRRAPNALAVALGVFVPLAVLSLLFAAILIHRRRQSAAILAKGFGRGTAGTSARRLQGKQGATECCCGESVGALGGREDERGSNSYAGLSVEESMAQSSALSGSSSAGALTEPETGSSPPSSPGLAEADLSQWTPGQPVPPPNLGPNPSRREEAMALPPYDPRRLEMIIDMSNEVVSKFEGERRGGGR